MFQFLAVTVLGLSSLVSGPPTDAQILAAMPKPIVGTSRDDITIVKNRLGAKAVTAEAGGKKVTRIVSDWECATYYTEVIPAKDGDARKKRVSVVYLETSGK